MISPNMMPPPCPPLPAISSPSSFPSDEQRKNDLIAAKLSKLKSPSKKSNSSMTEKANKHKNHEQNSIMPVEVKKEPKSEDNEDLPLTVARSNRDELTLHQETKMLF